jgi:hypothetical protein
MLLAWIGAAFAAGAALPRSATWGEGSPTEGAGGRR